MIWKQISGLGVQMGEENCHSFNSSRLKLYAA
jgi:hypothetical protein